MGSCSDKETNKKVSNTNNTSPSIHVEKGNSSGKGSDNLNDSQVNEYKELVYKFFQFQTYQLRCSNGDFGCPFCDYKEENRYQYVHLLLHAIRVGEDSENGKHKANHFAMARFLVIDLANDFKEEAARLSEEETEAIDKVVDLESEMNDLITKERQGNDELQGIRRELLKGLNDILRGNPDKIGIKNVGEIDSKVFIREMEKRCFSLEYAAIKGVEQCSLWQEKIKNPLWHPFQIVLDETGKPLRLVKEDDESLQDLKKEWGQEVHDAVVVAMNELHEYNPSGCYVVSELWNFNENRKAKLDEVISFVLVSVKDAFKVRKYKESVYEQLKSGTCDVTPSFGGPSCPFCITASEKDYNCLLRHAIAVAEGVSESARRRGEHLALAKYLVIDLKDETAKIMHEKSDGRRATPSPLPPHAASKPAMKRTGSTLGDPGSSSRPPTKRTRKASGDRESTSKKS